MKELMKPIIVLTVICVITAALLGATYTVTAPLISAAEKNASDAAMAEVLPSAASFTELKVDGVEGLLIAAKDEGGSGYVFKVQSKGFGGAYQVMVGIGSDGKITGTKLLDNNETPGLGSKTGMPDFTGQFIGKDSSLDGVDTITGATISSKAFMTAVQIAYEGFAAVGEGAK
ncbi:RnfABCDGE type electron transport complex subunit G [Oscillospiraceae bacterium PP1C4]